MEMLKKAIDVMGGQKYLAAKLGVSAGLVCQWRSGARSISERHTAEIEIVATHASAGETARRAAHVNRWDTWVRKAAKSEWAKPLIAGDVRYWRALAERTVSGAGGAANAGDLVCAGMLALRLEAVLPEWSADVMRRLDEIRI